MSPVKTAYVPRFGSSQRDDEPQPSPSQTVDRVESASRCRKKEKRANKRAGGENLQSPLKVKLPQFSAHKLSKKKATKGDGKTPGGRVLEPAASRPKPRTPVAPVAGAGDSQGAGTDIDAFFLSQTPTSKAADQKKKVKLTVLRTIAKMLEENHFIRQRLIALSQAQ